MASHNDIAVRWAAEAGKPDARMLHSRVANLYVSRSDDRNLLSWGGHFILARIMLDANGDREWFLVNGDKYSHSTSQHQAITRRAIAGTGLPSMIVPFSALEQAGIMMTVDTIVPVEILPDRSEPVTRYVATVNDVPSWLRDEAREEPDHTWSWQDREHHLGESVFTATYNAAGGWDNATSTQLPYRTSTATFLSSFDRQEGYGLYFLAELPQGCNPQTVAEAVEALKPFAVLHAETYGLDVLRQGDVFAIPVEHTTRDLTRLGGLLTIKVRPGGAYFLGVNHTATDVMTMPDGTTYARGILRHRPRETWRSPEHKMVRLGDRRTWYRLVKNTVPEGRSWSVGGNVD